MPYTAGQKIRASELNALPTSAVLVADATRNNSTSLTNLTGMNFTAEANSRYSVECVIYYSTNATADLKLQWSYPTGTTGFWVAFGVTTNDTDRIGEVDMGVVTIDTALAVTGDGALPVSCRPALTLITGSTAGTVQLRFAQNTAHASDTIVKVGSFLRITKLA